MHDVFVCESVLILTLSSVLHALLLPKCIYMYAHWHRSTCNFPPYPIQYSKKRRFYSAPFLSQYGHHLKSCLLAHLQELVIAPFKENGAIELFFSFTSEWCLRDGHTKSYDRFWRVASSYRKWTQVNVSERTSNVRHSCDH